MSIGIWQVVLILMIVLILFGAGKLPKVMGDVAKGVKSFKSGLKDDEDEVEGPRRPITSERTAAQEPEDVTVAPPPRADADPAPRQPHRDDAVRS
ncbi:MAG: twin-arginine translocase TatA/TatE family subunit [Geminicoccaceae bacterium]|nr:twin-arginine translocase TatA/TatE family subunit [Geminicoccaceae bacterium]